MLKTDTIWAGFESSVGLFGLLFETESWLVNHAGLTLAVVLLPLPPARILPHKDFSWASEVAQQVKVLAVQM